MNEFEKWKKTKKKNKNHNEERLKHKFMLEAF